MSGGDADDKTGRRHDSVVGAEHRCAEPSDSAGSMSFRLTHGVRDGAPVPDGSPLPMPVHANTALGQGPLGAEDRDNFYP